MAPDVVPGHQSVLISMLSSPLKDRAYSSEHALPPRMSRTLRACSRALPQLLRFMRLIISGATLPSSFSLPTYTSHLVQYFSEHPRGVRRHLQARQQPERDFRLCIHELLLYELERRERALELLALERVLARPVHAVLERAHRAPRDPEPRVVQAAEGRAEALPVREQRVVRDLHVVHEDRAGERAPQRELVLDRWRAQAFGALYAWNVSACDAERPVLRVPSPG